MVTQTLLELIREVDPDFESAPPPPEYRFSSGRTFQALPGRGAYGPLPPEASPGIYTITMAAGAGQYFYTGFPANLPLIPLTAERGEYSYVGNDADMNPTNLIAETGTFAYTGNDATLFYSSTSILVAEVGSFTATGQASTFQQTTPAAVTAYTFTGNAAALTSMTTGIFPAGTGTFSMSGADVAFGFISDTHGRMDAAYTATGDQDLVTLGQLNALIDGALA